MTLITGKDLADLFLVRLTNKLECHNDVKYHKGWNEDPLEFDPSGQGRAGGLYFCLAGMFQRFKGANGVSTWFVRRVTLDPEEPVWDEGNGSFKAKKICLGPRILISKFKINKEIYLQSIIKYGYAIKYVPKDILDRELCMTAVTNDGLSLEHIPYKLQDREMCITAVKQYGYALYYIPNNLKDYEMCMIAVNNLADSLYCVPNYLKDREMCLNAVKQDGNALGYVQNYLADREICLVAVKQNRCASCYVPKRLASEIRVALDLRQNY